MLRTRREGAPPARPDRPARCHRRCRPSAAPARPDPSRTAGRAHRVGGRASLRAPPPRAPVARRDADLSPARRRARAPAVRPPAARGAMGLRARSRSRAEERVPRTDDRGPGANRLRTHRHARGRVAPGDAAGSLAGHRSAEARAVPRVRRCARPAVRSRRIRHRAERGGVGAGRGAARGTAPADRGGVRRLVVPGAPLVPGADGRGAERARRPDARQAAVLIRTGDDAVRSAVARAVRSRADLRRTSVRCWSLLGRCALAFGPTRGLHLAAAVGVPVVSLWGDQRALPPFGQAAGIRRGPVHAVLPARVPHRASA